ncbi:MAG: hypothetical protein M3R00_07855 [Pseudomonadota bacterium]|nr:hypothetical protein [Pseudomonadota bacterium]
MDNKDGRKPILYDFPIHPPNDLIMFVESNPDQILLLVEFLETAPKPGIYLPVGTSEVIRKQIENFTKTSCNADAESSTRSFDLPPEQDDDYETKPVCK